MARPRKLHREDDSGAPDRRSDLGDEGMEPAVAIAWRRVTNRHEVQRGRPTVARSKLRTVIKAALNKGADVVVKRRIVARVDSRINPQPVYQA